jgi:hypothetical protein
MKQLAQYHTTGPPQWWQVLVTTSLPPHDWQLLILLYSVFRCSMSCWRVPIV